MATFNLGKVCVTPRGDYSPSQTYTTLDVVSYGGGSFLVLKECQGVTPAPGEYYMSIATKGSKGDGGQAATITVGNVTSLPSGSTPIVTNVGTESNAIFDFALPQGPQGDTHSVDEVESVDGNVALSAVRYAEQTLTDAEQLQARENIGAAKEPSTVTATLTTTWSAVTGGFSQHVSVSGVTGSNIVIVSPNAANYADYTENNVRCIAQASNQLTFFAETEPAAALTVNILIID